MKKIILSLVTLMATSLVGFADTTLAEAYKALAGLSGMSEKSVSSIQLTPSTSITDVKTAAINATPTCCDTYRAEFIYMMENLPVRNMVIGANNMRELAAVYSTPAGGGKYNILIVTGNSLNGNYSVSYGQTTKAGVDAMRNSQLSMDSDQLVVTPAPGNGNTNLVSVNN